MNQKYPKVIVLILSYNGKHLLKEAVSSYLENDYPNFEVVVIDNGSNDGTKEYVQKNFPKAKVIRIERNRGYSGGFNFGLDFAFNKNKADYVLITNNDVKADKKVISELVKVAETDEKIGFVTGKVYYYDSPNVFQTVGKKEDQIRWNGDHIGNREEDKGQYENISERCFADDIFTLVSKKLYRDIGGYDTTFFLQSEEYDWQARAKKLGYKIMYTPYAKIWHKESMTIGRNSALKAYYDARNPMLVILLHKSPQFFKRYFWIHFRQDVFRSSLVSLKQLKPLVALKKWQGFFSGIWWGIKNKKFTVRHFI
ncbi:MAG: glycosyltransferase family 2 protein [Candidatus Aenigmatarchaeota archaeon]|nr:MAG: glycosyltransferase family 2 protein [Candidatus Aenigmarchaeota archaeon]